MTDCDRKQFLSVLQAKEADIAAGMGRRDGLAVQAEADLFDEIQHAIDRALLVRNLDHGSGLLREVRNAVERIADGEYGSCQECGEERGGIEAENGEKPRNPGNRARVPNMRWAGDSGRRRNGFRVEREKYCGR